MYACLISLVLAMVGLAECVTHGLAALALYYTLAASFLVLKLVRLRRLHRLLRSGGWPLTPRDLAWADPSDFRGGAVPAFEDIATLPDFDPDLPPLENLRRLWVERGAAKARRARPSAARLASVAVVYAAVSLTILGVLTPFNLTVGEIAAAPLFFIYPRGIVMLTVATVLCYFPIYLGALALFELKPLRSMAAARGVGIFASIVVLAIFGTL